jgi:PIN domain nuclease of toxin-antitoxin system
MRVSLDTHVAIWWYQKPELLKEATLSILADKNNIVYVSAAVLWEISIKISLKKLKISARFFDYIIDDFQELPISWKHANEVKNLPAIHQDPFDRLLIAQAKTDDLTLITSDKNILKYNIKLIEA